MADESTALADPHRACLPLPALRQGQAVPGFLNLRPRCEVCGLDYAFADAGDGPAVFIILIAGFIVVGCALVVEFKYEPPLWLHALLWLPLILATTLLPLRSMKGLMVALQYHHRAAEGRADSRHAVTADRGRGGLLVPGAVALAALAVLLGLGTWQLERKAWKEALIATLDRRLNECAGRAAAAYRMGRR